MADISKIKLPNGSLYNIKDAAAVRKSGDTMTGPLVIQSELYADSTTTGNLVVNGDATFNNGLRGDLTGTINGHTVAKDVPANAVFTDTTDLTSMTGVLPVANGGTGKSVGKDAANYFLNTLDTGTSTPNDNTYYISKDTGTGTNYYRRPTSALWNYIRGKITTGGAIDVQTGDSKNQHITLQTFISWLITQGHIPSNLVTYKCIVVGWSYANNDFLQVTIDGINYEIHLAGCIIEFWGFATSYNNGVFRLRIHTSPARAAYAITSGYEYIPLSSIVEYFCNGSNYSPTWKMYSTSDTKNTAGSTDTSSKIFLIGATSQAANPQTYSQDTAYVGTDGCLYSGGSKVLTSHQDISGKVSKTGDTMTGPLIIQNSSSSEGLIIRSQMENYSDTCCIGFDIKDIPNIPCTWYFYLDKQNNKLRISHLRRGTSTKTYFYVNSEEQDTPSFRVGADLMVGHSTTDSQGCKMRYNSTTQSLDFVFS